MGKGARHLRPTKPPRPNQPPQLKSLYQPHYDEIVRDYGFLGADDDEMAELFEVSRSTINNWFRDHPTFKKAYDEGRVHADIKVAKSLYTRAVGYDVEVVSTEEVVTPNGTTTKTSSRTIHLPGDVTAQMRWLAVRRGWTEGGSGGGPLSVKVEGGLPAPAHTVDGVVEAEWTEEPTR